MDVALFFFFGTLLDICSFLKGAAWLLVVFFGGGIHCCTLCLRTGLRMDTVCLGGDTIGHLFILGGRWLGVVVFFGFFGGGQCRTLFMPGGLWMDIVAFLWKIVAQCSLC